MNLLKKLDSGLGKIEEFALSTSIILMTIILVGNVISRKVFNNSWTFAEEVGQYLVVITTFMGMGYAVQKSQHINMTAVLDFVPRNVKKTLIIISSVISTLTMFYFAYLSFKYSLTVVARGRVTPALEMPRYFITMFLPVGFSLAGIRYLLVLLLNLNNKNDIYVGTEEPAEDFDTDWTTGY